MPMKGNFQPKGLPLEVYHEANIQSVCHFNVDSFEISLLGRKKKDILHTPKQRLELSIMQQHYQTITTSRDSGAFKRQISQRWICWGFCCITSLNQPKQTHLRQTVIRWSYQHGKPILSKKKKIPPSFDVLNSWKGPSRLVYISKQRIMTQRAPKWQGPWVRFLAFTPRRSEFWRAWRIFCWPDSPGSFFFIQPVTRDPWV